MTTEPVAEPGWVDALCTCGDPDSHAGLFCPNRKPEEAVIDVVDHDAEIAAAEAAIADAQAKLADAQAAKGGN